MEVSTSPIPRRTGRIVNIDYQAHTDEGASARLPIGLGDADRGVSILGALCRGNAGVVDLDISHALAGGIKGREKRRQGKKRRV